MPMPGPVGVWIRTNSADYIIYPADTSAPHQNHVILHEIGHMIAGHKGDGHDADIITEWFPHISPDVVRSSLQRSHYDSEQEQEAEIVATIILEWAAVLERVALHSHSSFGKGELERALGDHLGWL
jgi:Zn-dependent peptidase ImmA (M78 family)